ncbi:MAG: DUF1573 domain-containing protein [Bacteroidaceae bacterium]|nr:DUF1573 domain-containing protein [Bacteroidaceae bacterium]
MTRWLFIILSLFTVHGLQAMNGEPVFDTYEWNFGKINEVDGIVSHTFMLTNKGKHDLLITKVVPSCSCVMVDYPRNPIKPGHTEGITISFLPSGAIGPVFRTIEVFNADNVCFGTLEISADVTPADRSIQERYHHTLAGFLYASQVKIPFGYIYHGEQQTKTVYIANTSDQVMKIERQAVKGPLQVTYPSVLEPGEEREVLLTYSSPSDPKVFATLTDTVFFIVNGQQANVPITTSMLCVEKIESSPAAPMLRTYPSFGKLVKKNKKSFVATIDIFNDGQSNLIIHSIETPERVCTNMQKEATVAPGGKATMELTADSPAPFYIKLFTNDPNRMVKEIEIKPQ